MARRGVNSLQADYLVMGAGAMGMAFTDALITETDATAIVVDRRHQPGGHWNDAYPFVRLHQPSAFYGVNSRRLGSNAIDERGWNKGLYELASQSEVCAYFGQVMQRQLLPSGRVQYFPLCECRGEGRFASLASGAEYRVDARFVVDATYMDVRVPSMNAPSFEVAPNAHCLPLNALPRAAGRFRRYAIVGAGKTGMDACLFLLSHGVSPAAISWIMPRDAWLLDRANIQPGGRFAKRVARGFAAQLRAIADARDVQDLFDRVAACGQLLRLDPNVRPTAYRCATVTEAELRQLRRIKNVVRMGRVRRINGECIVLDGGEIPTTPDTLHVHCAADGLARRPPVPIFQGGRITLQAVRTCQQVFSAAFIAHVQATCEDEQAKNVLCRPVPHPNSDIDYLRTTLETTLNHARWAQDDALRAWLLRSRLDGFSAAADSEDAQDAQESSLEAEMDPSVAMAAVAKLQSLLTAERPAEGASVN